MRLCRVTGCGAPTASRFSPHCRRHKSRLRRQGDTEQTAIKIGELAPYCRRVRQRITKNQQSPLWAHLEAEWGTIVAEAKANAERVVQNRYERQAANMLVGISHDTTARDIIVTTAAMFLLHDETPGRFVSDAAFRLQLAKRVLSLSYVNTGVRYDYATDKEVRVYREPSPKARIIIGRKLAKTFGAVGLQLAVLERKDRERQDQAVDDMRQAMRELV